jgi:hypothetical protein
MIDAGGIKGNATSGVVSELIYAWQKYMQSGSYIRFNGRPVVFYFGVESLPVDWNYVRNNVPGNPLFVFENAALFGQSFADGAFSWVGDFTSPTDWGQAYLDNFYATGQGSGKHTVGSVKKGFNSTGAAWGANRVVNQNCGQTWLNTFGDIGNHYSSGRQLESLQLVTWNDYEEGTALEMGIDNCVSISGSASGSNLSWNVSGNENTINHYSVYISTDGENLMPVTDVPAGTHSLNLSQFGFAKDAYTVYVQAVGQPSIRNHMSGPIGFSADGSSSGATASVPAGADLTLSATPTKVTVAQGGSASTTVTVTPSGNFDASVNLGCANLAPGLSCSFTQSSMVPGSKATTTMLTVSANSGAQSASLRGLSLGSQLALWFPGLGVGMVLFSERKKSRKAIVVLVVVAIAVMMLATGCGGGGKGSSSPLTFSNSASGTSAPGTYQITIVAQSGSLQRTTSATVTVQ